MQPPPLHDHHPPSVGIWNKYGKQGKTVPLHHHYHAVEGFTHGRRELRAVLRIRIRIWILSPDMDPE
jgi:hypothetical protein